MGVTILIGNKVTDGTPNDSGIAVITLPDAPTFGGDNPPGKSNKRMMSYKAFDDFCRACNLTTVLYQPVVDNHPGELEITEHLVNEIDQALRAYEARLRLPAGFGLLHDGHRARLRWFHWWMRWALRTCERPTLANS